MGWAWAEYILMETLDVGLDSDSPGMAHQTLQAWLARPWPRSGDISGLVIEYPQKE